MFGLNKLFFENKLKTDAFEKRNVTRRRSLFCFISASLLSFLTKLFLPGLIIS